MGRKVAKWCTVCQRLLLECKAFIPKLLNELDQELSEDEITTKGFWKQKFALVEKYLDKQQVINR